MRLMTAGQTGEIDGYAIDTLKIPGTTLMMNAAKRLEAVVTELLPDGGSVAAVCGAGNNGGDGIAVSARLLRRGYTVRVFLASAREKMTLDALEMERRLHEMGGVLETYAECADADKYLADCDLIVDALFGTGLRSELRGDALDLVGAINASRAKVVSADIPSGVFADNGLVGGAAVNADVTVTFTTAKPGHFLTPGCLHVGELRVCGIGVPEPVLEDLDFTYFSVTDGDIALPRRAPDSHKGDYGKDLIVAGSVGCTGAPVIAAKAASLTGAGLVTLLVPQDIYAIAATQCDGEMAIPVPCADGCVSESAVSGIIERLGTCTAALVGPGLGRTAEAVAVVHEIIKSSRVPLILDADGINALSGNIDILDMASCPVILTPHDGEFRRIGGDVSTGDRLPEAVKFAVAHGCVLVLKGHRTITAMPDGSAYINTTGSPALAKGGTGDALAGMMLGLLGQGFALKDAVLAAVYLHGLAGELCAARYGEYSLTPGRLLESIPDAMKSVCKTG